MTNYEKCMAGEPFDGDSPELRAMALQTRRLLIEYRAAAYDDAERKAAILRKMLGSVGEQVHIDIDFHCEYGKNIHLGNKVIINMNCTFVDNNRIDIGDNVLIASNVQLYTAYHSVRESERIVHEGEEGLCFCRCLAKPIRIGDGAWLGGGVIVLPGVSIGARSVIGAGSVVTRDIPPDCVAVGNPCRVIRTNING